MGAGVKSMKFHLKRVIADTLLTFEEMTTLLIQIEAVLNSRPLCPLTDDPDDFTALTPGHFIMGCAPTVIPEPSLEYEVIPSITMATTPTVIGLFMDKVVLRVFAKISRYIQME